MALLRDPVGETLHPRLAEGDEPIDPVRLDIALVGEPKLPLRLDLDPQSLAVEAVLISLALAEHGVVPHVEILVGAAPGVMYAHRVVRGDRPVKEAVATNRLLVAGEVALDSPRFAPGVDLLALEGGHLQLAGNRLEHSYSNNKHSRPGPGTGIASRGITRA